jgi:hypothetical protein
MVTLSFAQIQRGAQKRFYGLQVGADLPPSALRTFSTAQVVLPATQGLTCRCGRGEGRAAAKALRQHGERAKAAPGFPTRASSTLGAARPFFTTL